ncbi:MAG: UDP-N-acetylmuramoyl-L-alanyl-D-glutamate--2,6-diaminopimelate ligase [Ktedonobacterales bacterium]|nr:UDP-N-acetylmuramoyl-L-alanyl-D-glutamate--2,6-diaminopimelate ligase [Ktedonobacterales bacterium]
MHLADLLRGFDRADITFSYAGPPTGSLDVSAITYNSQVVQPGALFVARPGHHADGHHFIPDAVARGASVIVGSRDGAEFALPGSVGYLRVDHPARALGLLACAFYGQPSRQMAVIGVTGTDGKTSTVNLIAAILDAAGHTSGLTSTVDFKIGPQRIENETRFTNLEAPELQAVMAQMVAGGVDYAVIESTSSGLELERLAGIEYDVAVVTNITSEHLEVHGSKEAYWRAKAMLFERVDPLQAKEPGPPFVTPRVCVLNADDASYAFLSRFCRAPILTYGIENPGADVNAHQVVLRADGSSFAVALPDGTTFQVESPLVARFNVANCLAAIAACWSQGVAPEVIAHALATFSGVPGRMERIDAGQDFAVIVDYAHTAESLHQVLTVLRPLTRGRLIAVFGSAGDRDRTKRPEMGAVAAENADYFVITDEDPRTEDALSILREIAAGAVAAGATEGVDFINQVGRREAIARAFAVAGTGDTVVLCGKGHEQSIIIGTAKLPWDDRRVARELLNATSVT